MTTTRKILTTLAVTLGPVAYLVLETAPKIRY